MTFLIDYTYTDTTATSSIVLESSEGDVADQFIPGSSVVIQDTTSNNGEFTITDAYYSSGQTTIDVAEFLNDESGGMCYVYPDYSAYQDYIGSANYQTTWSPSILQEFFSTPPEFQTDIKYQIYSQPMDQTFFATESDDISPFIQTVSGPFSLEFTVIPANSILHSIQI